MRTGLLPITGCDNSDRQGNVFFVHGLMGHPIKTWHPNEDALKDKDIDSDDFWKNDLPNLEFFPNWLGKAKPDLGIWSFGYVADFRANPGTLPVFDQAKFFQDELAVNQLQSKPLIFITYSLGGILFKKMLETADIYKHHRDGIIKTSKGVIFLATPHSTSSLPHLANDIGIFSTILSVVQGVVDPAPYVETLRNRDGQLTELKDWYRQKHGDLNIITRSYHETQNMNGILVVNRDAADPGIQDVENIGIPGTDHQTIAKPISQQSFIFKRAIRLIDDVLNTSLPQPLPSLKNVIQKKEENIEINESQHIIKK